MRRVVTFWRLDKAARGVMVEALTTLWAWRLVLWVMPLARARNFLASFSGWKQTQAAEASLVPWSVARTSRYVPRATCLVQALAAQAMLSRRSVNTEIRIGVLRGDDSSFEAHAWLEADGRVLLGRAEEDRYTPLVALAPGDL